MIWNQRIRSAEVIPSIPLRHESKEAVFSVKKMHLKLSSVTQWCCGGYSWTEVFIRDWKHHAESWDFGGLWCFCGVICENGVITLDILEGGWKIFLFMKREGDTSSREDSGPLNRARNAFALFIFCVIYLHLRL